MSKIVNSKCDESIERFREQIKDADSISIRGAATKHGLIRRDTDSVCLDARELSGISQYDPTEFTFTAFAGTPLLEIATELEKHGQYLPFDPPFVDQGATLGGAVASGINGSCRLTYGGVRDFILGVRFIDGCGDLIWTGGKVVKNSAGFDLPKFFVGSLGRFGFLTELTFKVFPKGTSSLTIKFSLPDIEAIHDAILKLICSPLQIDAIDVTGSDPINLLVRMSGAKESIDPHSQRAIEIVGDDNYERLDGIEERSVWNAVRAMESFKADASSLLCKIPMSLDQLPILEKNLLPICISRRYVAACNAGWFCVASEVAEQFFAGVSKLELDCLVVRGEAYAGEPPIVGAKPNSFVDRVKQALDPQNKFGALM